MRRVLLGVAAASLTILIGVALATLRQASCPELPKPNASLPAVKPYRESPQPDFREVFRDFDFVGSSSIAEAMGDECACPPGSKVALPKPEVFEAGRAYAFRFRGDADTDLLFEALQTRFTSFGLETSVLPGVFLGMRLHPHGLQFQGRGFEGSVRRSLPRMSSNGSQQSRLWDGADIILFLEKRPL